MQKDHMIPVSLQRNLLAAFLDKKLVIVRRTYHRGQPDALIITGNLNIFDIIAQSMPSLARHPYADGVGYYDRYGAVAMIHSEKQNKVFLWTAYLPDSFLKTWAEALFEEWWDSVS